MDSLTPNCQRNQPLVLSKGPIRPLKTYIHIYIGVRLGSLQQKISFFLGRAIIVESNVTLVCICIRNSINYSYINIYNYSTEPKI